MTEEELQRILNEKRNFVQISGASIAQTKKEVDEIEKDVIDIHKKMV